MPVMYCFIDPFVINQNIFFAEQGEKDTMHFLAKMPLDDLPAFFATSYSNNGCSKIILYSGSQEYTEEMAQKIKEYGMTKYNLDDINIEVIKSK